uniref:PCNA-interacting partner n=1 Tax=Sus scrofa TaxID=9823 RepID=A0A8D1XAM3_PIG
MAVLNQKSVMDMIKEFRRNWHSLCNSERTTVCGADSMLLALQLSMAENNKQHSGEFTVSLSDVLLTWKYLLHEKLNLPVENMKVNDHYENIRRIYHDFLKNSNMLDLIDVYNKCSVLTSNYENHTNISPVSIFLYNSIFIKGLQQWHMEVPRQIGVKLELQLSSYIIAAAMPDPSIFCNLH